MLYVCARGVMDVVFSLCRYGCIYLLAALVLMCVDVMVMSST